jgi:signal recognition particle GTPase
MKINKKLMSEAAQRAKLSLVEDAEGIDPKDGISEIAADVEKEVEMTTDGAATVSAAGAEEIAQEIKEVSAEVKPVAVAIAPSFKALGVKNRITEKLDFALSIAKKNKRRGEHVECNVLIVGLPGSGKTASIND